MSLNDKTCSEFLNELAPRSCSRRRRAAAMGGAIGMALSNMVANLTLGKKNMPVCRMR